MSMHAHFIHVPHTSVSWRIFNRKTYKIYAPEKEKRIDLAPSNFPPSVRIVRRRLGELQGEGGKAPLFDLEGTGKRLNKEKWYRISRGKEIEARDRGDLFPLFNQDTMVTK